MGVSVNQIIQETLSNFGQKQSQQTDGNIANALNLEVFHGGKIQDQIKKWRADSSQHGAGGAQTSKAADAQAQAAKDVHTQSPITQNTGGSRQWGSGGGEHPAGVANRSGFKGGQHPTAGANTSGQMNDARVASHRPAVSPQAQKGPSGDGSGVIDHLKDAASNPWVQGAAGAAGLVGAGLAGRKYLKARRAKAGK